MKTSATGRAFIQEFEDLSLVAYPDPKTGGDPWTCGYGITGPDVCKGTTWTLSYALQRFETELAQREVVVNREIKVPITQGMFDALVSILWNVGYGSAKKDGIFRLQDGRPSTLVRLLNAGDYKGAAEQFERWVSPGSNVENGLRRRRKGEKSMFLRGGMPHVPPRPMPAPAPAQPYTPIVVPQDVTKAPAPKVNAFIEMLQRLFAILRPK